MKHYVWDGRRIRAVDPAVLRNGETRQDRLSASLAKFRSAAYDAIFPNPRSVRLCASQTLQLRHADCQIVYT